MSKEFRCSIPILLLFFYYSIPPSTLVIGQVMRLLVCTAARAASDDAVLPSDDYIRIEKKEGKTKSDVKKQEASIMPPIGFSKIPYKIAKFPKSDGIFGIFGIFEMAKC